MTKSIQKLIERWEKAEQLASDHERAGNDVKHLIQAWKEDCFEVADLYNRAYLKHQEEHTNLLVRVVILRQQLDDELVKTASEGAELIQPYLDYIETGGVFTYQQYIDAIKELEQEVSTPIDTSENPEPF